jgi:hypothetical protein
MTREEAAEILQQIGDRLESVIKAAAPALPEPEYNYEEIFQAIFTEPNLNPLKPAARVILLVEPLVSFVESQILPIINSTPEAELKQFRQRKGKQHAA